MPDQSQGGAVGQVRLKSTGAGVDSGFSLRFGTRTVHNVTNGAKQPAILMQEEDARGQHDSAEIRRAPIAGSMNAMNRCAF